ncbi:WYL domain-containing protein [Arcobacter sp. KX21116]|uniref:helix-turn-helix transcriptional regulator n=1 Tax=Arcobacter iocasae TaxID=2906515 RepID=UPI0035D45B4C
MSDTTQFDAHLYLIQKILRKEQISTLEVANYLNKSDRQVRRYIEQLSPLFEFPIEYDKEWIVPDFIMDVRSYTPEDLVIINALLTKVEKDNPVLYTRAIDMFEVLNEKASHVIFKQSSIENIMVKYKKEFYLIKEAIEKVVEIKFNYYSEKYPKHVQPLKIANLERYWYLLCYNLNEKKFCKYHFSGLKDIDLLNVHFKLESHDYKNRLDNAINAYFNLEESSNVRLRLSKDARRVLSRKKLNQTQNIFKDEHDDYIMDIEITHLMEIAPVVQQWIPHIEVVYPEKLRTLIKENLKKYENLK